MLEASRRVNGKEHQATLAATASLAITCAKQGRLDEAEALDVEMREVARRLRGV